MRVGTGVHRQPRAGLVLAAGQSRRRRRRLRVRRHSHAQWRGDRARTHPHGGGWSGGGAGAHRANTRCRRRRHSVRLADCVRRAGGAPAGRPLQCSGDGCGARVERSSAHPQAQLADQLAACQGLRCALELGGIAAGGHRLGQLPAHRAELHTLDLARPLCGRTCRAGRHSHCEPRIDRYGHGQAQRCQRRRRPGSSTHLSVQPS
mmetsp:Transcript_5210/g.15924  ORF Transcript_5210/g.15924 Transcript_5210/m.15924 type:complete len:205 (-) Transcript_5210:397-1011(-)